MNFLTPSTPAASNQVVEPELDRQAQVTIDAWEALDLSNLQLALEDQATQLVELEENRLARRKELASGTKDLRTAAPETNAQALEVVKLYQASLEEVSGQAKFSSNAFLTLFKMLRDLPDPSNSLRTAFDNLNAAKHRVKQLEEREESLTNALRLSRERAKGAEELRAERDQFRETVQLDGDAQLDRERVAAQEKLALAQANFEEDIARVQTQLDMALEEIERLKQLDLQRDTQLEEYQAHESRTRMDSKDLSAAKTEGYDMAEKVYLDRLERASQVAEENYNKYEEQLEELRMTISNQLEQLGKLKEDLTHRPDIETHEKLKAQLRVMTKISTANGNNTSAEQDATDHLDGLEAWLLSTNQRLVEELNQAKEEISTLTQAKTQDTGTCVESPSKLNSGFESSEAASSKGNEGTNINAMKSQRDRLRGVLEKRDLEIERLQNQLDEREQKYRRLEDESEKLRQRVRFLQSYKVSERSTLLPGNLADPEAAANAKGPAMLGRGVGHEYRNLWEMEQASKGDSWSCGGLLAKGGKRESRRNSMVLLYLCIVHIWILFSMFRSSCVLVDS